MSLVRHASKKVKRQEAPREPTCLLGCYYGCQGRKQRPGGRLLSHGSHSGKHLALDCLEQCAAAGRNVAYAVGESELIDACH